MATDQPNDIIGDMLDGYGSTVQALSNGFSDRVENTGEPHAEISFPYIMERQIVRDQPSSETRVTDPDTGGSKGRKSEEYALIPVEPLAEVARVYSHGAGKYDPNNWRRGYAWSLSYSALQRHINQFWAGQSYDDESGLHHLAHAAFHLFSLMTFDGVGIDDDSRQERIDQFAKYLTKDDRP